MATLLSCVMTMARADVTVIEYYHSGFGHYFITPVAMEIELLDARTPPFELWSRTGVTFRAFDRDAAPAGSVAVCRFFNVSFAPKSSHFYAPHGLGCEATLANFPDWKLEDDRLFAAMLPDATGACPAATVPVYRLYNNGKGGAPNHRFVTTLADRQAMLDKGYSAEGEGIGVGMCIPPGAGERTTAEGFWRGVTNLGQALRVIILSDGSYHIVYSDPGKQNDAGEVAGSGISAKGVFASSNAVDVPFLFGSGLGSGPASINATYVARSSMQFNYGTTSATLSYDATYDALPNLASLAGKHVGNTGHREITRVGGMTMTMDAQGHIELQGTECNLSGVATPRGQANVFDVTLTKLTGPCNPTTRGILVYEELTRKLFTLTERFLHPISGFQDAFFAITTKQ
ncbi:MAG: hypothetical protein ABI624_00335 [Casimicrobiaceae bacterium]